MPDAACGVLRRRGAYADAALQPGYPPPADDEADAKFDDDAAAAPLPEAAPLRVHRFVLSARADYWRAALSPAFCRASSCAGGATRVVFCVPELCAAGTAALREWLYTDSVRGWQQPCSACDAASEVGIAARVASAADARLLPALASLARERALAALAAVSPAGAAAAAAAAAEAGEWGVAGAAVRTAAAGFAALRDSGQLDALPPALAEAIRAAHVARTREGGDA